MTVEEDQINIAERVKAYREETGMTTDQIFSEVHRHDCPECGLDKACGKIYNQDGLNSFYQCTDCECNWLVTNDKGIPKLLTSKDSSHPSGSGTHLIDRLFTYCNWREHQDHTIYKLKKEVSRLSMVVIAKNTEIIELKNLVKEKG